MKIICTGDLVADLIVPIRELPLQAEMHQFANERLLVAGGSSNFLIVASRLGLEAQAIGAVGDDWLGQLVLQQLQDEAVGVGCVDVVPEATTAMSIELVDVNSQHVFIGALGSGQNIGKSFDYDDVVLGSEAVFCTSYALGDHSLFIPANSLQILKRAHQYGIPTFFDLGPAAFSVDREIIRRAINVSTIVLTTQDELLTWTGSTSNVQGATEILSLGPDMIVIKMGSRGCVIVSAHEQISVEGFEVSVRDTAGAGDAFAAAFVYAYLRQYSLAQVGAIANATGAITVTRLGTGTQLPQRSEIFQLLQEHGFEFDDSIGDNYHKMS